jgi:hypothetical protein
MRLYLMALSLSALAPLALAAGVVEVNFKPVDELTDVGRGSLEGDRNVKALADHFRTLAARLPDGQTLKVDVLDVDMAGHVKPSRLGGDLRVLRGGADWPSLDLQWSLQEGGRTVSSGKDRISDLTYLQQPLRLGATGTVAYETRLIDRWFDQHFGSKAP